MRRTRNAILCGIIYIASSSLDARPMIVAHRGFSGQAPENTVAAFHSAIEIGADMLEMDIRLSRDGVPMIIHDATIGRTTTCTENLEVHTLTAAELQQFDAGIWFDARFKGQRIPSLKEVLGLPRGHTRLMLELKKGPESPRILAARVMETLASAHYVPDGEDIVIGCMDPEVVEALLHYLPASVVVGIAQDSTALNAFLNLKVKNISIRHDLITSLLVAELKMQGKNVYIWTIDNPNQLHDFFDTAFGFITNEPAKLLKAQETQRDLYSRAIL